MTMTSAWPALRACTVMALHRTWMYRARISLWVFRNLIMLFSLRMIWTAVYGERETMNGITLPMMMIYVTIAMLQQYLLEPVAGAEIERRIQRGTIAGDLIRPVGLIPQILAYDVGTLLGRIPLVCVVMPFAALIGSLQPPPTVGAAVGYLASLILAYVLSTLVWLPVGMVGFWTINVAGIRFLAFSVFGFVSGQMVPLWFMPESIRTLLEWLPFQAMVFAPLAIYVGDTTGSDILITLAVQVFWIIVMAWVVWQLWKRGANIIQIQGG
ncbi:MAG: ABC-2 family transporter protein [Thermomicrobiales bacterium]|nr:ABC-2 family transporter protein [Thermomicrobiales bacterium]MCO5225174.1 ABC-2 family transporter protein [Thermomicrobiales bacterium]